MAAREICEDLWPAINIYTGAHQKPRFSGWKRRVFPDGFVDVLVNIGDSVGGVTAETALGLRPEDGKGGLFGAVFLGRLKGGTADDF
jgi:hypothetical protein